MKAIFLQKIVNIGDSKGVIIPHHYFKNGMIVNDTVMVTIEDAKANYERKVLAEKHANTVAKKGSTR